MRRFLLILSAIMLVGGGTLAYADFFATVPGSGTAFAAKIIGGVSHVINLTCDATLGEAQCQAVNASGQAGVIEANSAAIKAVSGTVGTAAGCAAGTSSTEIQCLYQLHADVTSSIPGGANTIGSVNQAGAPWTFSLPTGAATSALQGTNTATTAHTCSTGGFSELGCLGKIDDDIQNQPVPTGTNNIGTVGLAPIAGTGCTPGHLLSTASTNAKNIQTGASTLCSMTAINTTATVYYLKLYNTAGTPTCNSDTVLGTYPVPASTSGSGVTINLGPYGFAFSSGPSFCLTGGLADNDNTNAAAGVAVSWSTK